MEPSPEPLRLPALSSVALDDLIDELSARARAIRSEQERLRTLLDAVVAVSVDLDLHDVLERVVVAACRVAGARYGALGVIGGDATLVEFVTWGVDEEARRTIGDLPHGHGLLGLIIDRPEPLRVDDIAEHPASYGVPPNHPAMHSFLGVPLRVGDEVFGNLYLTEKIGAERFSDADEEVVVALAAAAGLAVTRARLYEVTRRREQWLAAAAEISAALLSAAPRGQALWLVARRAREVAHAELALICLLDEGALHVEVAEGSGADGLDDQLLMDSPALDRVLSGAGPLIVRGVDEVARVLRVRDEAATRAAALPGELVVVPMRAGGRAVGALLLVREPRSSGLAPEQELQMAATFAEQAALTLELARAQADRARLAVFEERDRIARDLHDLVVQRLFAVGLSLRAVTRGQVPEDERMRRIEAALADLSGTSAEIRSTIHRLHVRPGEGDLVADVEGVVAGAQPSLGFLPDLHVRGAAPSDVADDLAADLLAVLREALSNVARHAKAHAADVTLTWTPDAVELTVVDDGQGLTRSGRSSGLANMAARALAHGGSCSVLDRIERGDDETGTAVCWRVPVVTS